jgi:hypothetical protein
MPFRFMMILLSAGIATFVPAEISDDLRNHFEWGEYQNIIDTLEPLFISKPDLLDSGHCAVYHCYLGVAYFATGRIGDAQKQFFIALSFNSNITLDRHYISEEIASLFASTKIDFFEKENQSRIKDSLIITQKQALEANLKISKLSELSVKKRTKTIWAITLFTIGASFAGISAFEYYTTKPHFKDFRDAANAGDKPFYDKLRPEIRRANYIIIGCSITAGISEIAGLFLILKK